MSPRKLQNEIKQDFRTDGSVWSGYRDTIVNNFATINYQDLSDHLLREFNRKVDNLGLSTTLFFEPFDAGFRFLGVSIGGGNEPSPGYIFVFASGEQVLTNEGDSIEIPEQYAND